MNTDIIIKPIRIETSFTKLITATKQDFSSYELVLVIFRYKVAWGLGHRLSFPVAILQLELDRPYYLEFVLKLLPRIVTSTISTTVERAQQESTHANDQRVDEQETEARRSMTVR